MTQENGTLVSLNYLCQTATDLSDPPIDLFGPTIDVTVVVANLQAFVTVDRLD